MKIKKDILIIFLNFLLVILYSCNNISHTKPDAVLINDSITQKTTATNKIANDSTIILSLTKQILTAIKNKDYKKLTEYFHPVEGVRFSPNIQVDDSRDMKFSKVDFNSSLKKNKLLHLGVLDESGDDISLTLKKYFSRYVYDADFLNAEKTNYSDTFNGLKSLHHLLGFYPNCQFTESYFSGFDKKYEGMDWRLLRLVYKKYLNRYYLVGIIHGEWEI